MKQAIAGTSLLTIAVVVALAPIIFVLFVVPPGPLAIHVRQSPETLDTIERIDANLNTIARAAISHVQESAETATAIAVFLEANPGSPLALLPIQEAAKYLATRENLVAWVASVEELGDIDLGAIKWTDDLQHLWGICQQEQALYAFVVQHSDRERRRWLDREQSVSLEAELQPVRQFMDRNLGNDSEVWRLASLFSDEVANKIRGEGENADDGDDEESRWDLFRALAQAGSPSFDAVVETLRTNTK